MIGNAIARSTSSRTTTSRRRKKCPDPGAGGRMLAMLRWGLVPYWATDNKKIVYSLINAKAESVAESRANRFAPV